MKLSKEALAKLSALPPEEQERVKLCVAKSLAQKMLEARNLKKQANTEK